MQSVVILGTGGTIAGAAARPQDHVGYQAGALGAEELLAAVPPLQGLPIQTQTLARLDSCDMDHETWQQLACRVTELLARPDVGGVVITHGTDTLEETAYFLHRTVDAVKPVVMTAAMRPASALSADGPQNLLDAVSVAMTEGARGVVVAFGGRIIAATDLRKVHGYRVDAFDGGDGGPVGVVENGTVRLLRAWPLPSRLRPDCLRVDPTRWPVVDIVTSHAGVRAAVIDALVAAGARGIVIAGTGNGSVHRQLLEAAQRAQSAGVTVWRSSRCLLGGVVDGAEHPLPSAGVLTPMQTRVELMLSLMPEEPPE
jgi:L-asparaginase